MITRIKISLSPKNKIPRPSHNWGYALYGALVEKLDDETAAMLHDTERPLLSQYLFIDKETDRCEWNVTLFGGAPDSSIMAALRDEAPYSLTKCGAELAVNEVAVSPRVTERDLCVKYLAESSPSREAAIRFITPCSFKSGGEYAILPRKEWIIQSCVNRWNISAQDTKIDDEQAVGDIINHTRITKHHLRSALYDMKNVKIPSFIGFVTLSARGPEALLRLFNLLMAFGGYAGIGIKTTLGMGGAAVGLGRDGMSLSAAT